MSLSLPKTQKAVRMMQRPVGNIVPGQDLVVFEEPVPEVSQLQEGEVLLHRLFLSLDPAMRGWMRDLRSYVPPVPVGAVMRGATVNEVVVSKSSKFKPGDIVQTKSADEAWVEFAVFPDKDVIKIQVAPGVEHLPLSAYLGVLGPTGLTAYFGLTRVGVPKAGETVLVSGAHIYAWMQYMYGCLLICSQRVLYSQHKICGYIRLSTITFLLFLSLSTLFTIGRVE